MIKEGGRDKMPPFRGRIMVSRQMGHRIQMSGRVGFRFRVLFEMRDELDRREEFMFSKGLNVGFVLSLLPFMEANAASAAAIERERELLMFTILGWFSVLLLIIVVCLERGGGGDALETLATQGVGAGQEFGRVLGVVVARHACRAGEKVVGEGLGVYVYGLD